MRRKELYKYQDGETTVVSPIKPADESIIIGYLFRIIADEGKLLKKDTRLVYCLDVEIPDSIGWEEIDDPDYIPPDEDGGEPTEE